MIVKLEEIIDEKEDAKSGFLKTQAEKTIYLGEFKEEILGALEISEIELKIIHPEIKKLVEDKRAILMKIRRDIPFELIKPYIEIAEKKGLRYTLVDDITFHGNIGLVIVSKEALDNANENVILESMTKKYTDVGLSKGFIYGEGKKISDKNYKKLKEELPECLDKFEKIGFLDKIFGVMCPIDNYNKRRGK